MESLDNDLEYDFQNAENYEYVASELFGLDQYNDCHGDGIPGGKSGYLTERSLKSAGESYCPIEGRLSRCAILRKNMTMN